MTTWNHSRKGTISGREIPDESSSEWMVVELDGDHALRWMAEWRRGWVNTGGSRITVRRSMMTEIQPDADPAAWVIRSWQHPTLGRMVGIVLSRQGSMLTVAISGSVDTEAVALRDCDVRMFDGRLLREVPMTGAEIDYVAGVTIPGLLAEGLLVFEGQRIFSNVADVPCHRGEMVSIENFGGERLQWIGGPATYSCGGDLTVPGEEPTPDRYIDPARTE